MTVVGRKSKGGATPTPKPTPTPTVSATPTPTTIPMPVINPPAGAGFPILNNINSRLATYGLSAVTENVSVTTDELLQSMPVGEKRLLGIKLTQAGFNVPTLAKVDEVIASYFPNIEAKNYADLLRQIDEQLVNAGTSKGPSTSLSITDYGKEQIDNWIDDGLRKKFGRGIQSLSEQELSTLRKAVSDYASTPQATTVTKDAMGRTVTKTKPGATTAGIASVVEKSGMDMFGKEAERRKAFEFIDELQKIMSGGM